jgi:hypothetical protein
MHQKSPQKSHTESSFSAKSQPFELNLDFLNREGYQLQNLNREGYQLQHIEKWQEFIQPLAGIQKFSSRTLTQKLVSLEKTFEFPPTVIWILVIFQYVVADIFLYSKSLGSAQTVEI